MGAKIVRRKIVGAGAFAWTDSSCAADLPAMYGGTVCPLQTDYITAPGKRTQFFYLRYQYKNLIGSFLKKLSSQYFARILFFV
jgi:hypothetical protein